MLVDLKNLEGPWDDGYALHKHKISSLFTGYNDAGYPTFDTTRTEPGEALFQLKYRSDWSKAAELAKAINDYIIPKFEGIGLIIPMPASTIRARQPVTEVCKELAPLVGVSVFDNTILSKASGAALKNMSDRAEKLAALTDRMKISDGIGGDGKWNALLVDDLFDSGASMEAASNALRGYAKIAKIYTVALTWT